MLKPSRLDSQCQGSPKDEDFEKDADLGECDEPGHRCG